MLFTYIWNGVDPDGNDTPLGVTPPLPVRGIRISIDHGPDDPAEYILMSLDIHPGGELVGWAPGEFQLLLSSQNFTLLGSFPL
jgi:hypothetical protein